MINISISTYGTPKVGNKNISSFNRKKKRCQEDYLIFVGEKKYTHNGFFNDGFKHKEISQKPVKAVYEI